MPPSSVVLVVEDDAPVLRLLVRMLGRDGFAVVTATSGVAALQAVQTHDVRVAIVDWVLPDASGGEIILQLRATRPQIECIVLTGMARGRGAEEARVAGASDYFEKSSMDVARFLQVVRRASQVHHLRHTVELLEPEGSPRRILGSSVQVERVRSMVDRMATTSATILVTGESGVGKEVVAQSLHDQSGRTGEFVRINCAALPEALFEAELFGAEDGTYTGQKGRKAGLLSIADHGTLFLDEIGEMPIGLQPKLLRVLESLTYRPLGSRTERALTARVIAGTNADLRLAVRSGTFREDLFYRLAVLTIAVPPLRERAADIPLLAAHFAKKFAATEGRTGVMLSEASLRALEGARWPGNVRELANTILRAVVLTHHAVIEPADLGLELPDKPHTLHEESLTPYFELQLTEAKAALVDAFTREYLRRRLAASDGNITLAATHSGLQRPNFKREMTRLGVRVDESTRR